LSWFWLSLPVECRNEGFKTSVLKPFVYPSDVFPFDHFAGTKTDGGFVHTPTLTDIASGWTQCLFIRTNKQMLRIEALKKVASDLVRLLRETRHAQKKW